MLTQLSARSVLVKDKVGHYDFVQIVLCTHANRLCISVTS